MTEPSSDWKQRLMDQVDSIPEARRATESKRVGLHFPPRWYALIGDAAAMRKMSKGAYVRRAAMAFVVHDLGLEYDDVFEGEPPVREIPDDPQSNVMAAHGMGFGRWKILGLGK